MVSGRPDEFGRGRNDTAPGMLAARSKGVQQARRCTLSDCSARTGGGYWTDRVRTQGFVVGVGFASAGLPSAGLPSPGRGSPPRLRGSRLGSNLMVSVISLMVSSQDLIAAVLWPPKSPWACSRYSLASLRATRA